MEDHYKLNSEDLFSIMIQISRFLREFNDFESELTPDFRHPHILGNYNDLIDVGLIEEL